VRKWVSLLRTVSLGAMNLTKSSDPHPYEGGLESIKRPSMPVMGGRKKVSAPAKQASAMDDAADALTRLIDEFRLNALAIHH